VAIGADKDGDAAQASMKTKLLLAYCMGALPDYVPTVMDNYIVPVTIEGHTIDVSLVDTAGQDEYERLRPLAYPNTDVFLFCFAIMVPSSLRVLVDKYLSEIEQHRPEAIRILVGLNPELREDATRLNELKQQSLHPVTTEEALQVKDTIKAVAYIECSYTTRENVKELFDEAIRTLWKQRQAEGGDKKRCTIS